MTRKTALIFTVTLTGAVNPLGEGSEDDPAAQPMTVSELYRNLHYAVDQVILGNGLITGDSYGTVESHDTTVTVTKGYPWENDIGLSAEALEIKYSPQGDGEHPHITRAFWRERVANEETALGYWTWLADWLHTYDPDNDA